MFFHNWRQKRKLKKFRPIAILSTDAFYRHGFHPVLLRPKTVLKEIKTSVIRKEEHTHHIHHNMTMHVHQAQTFLQLQQQSNSSSLVIQSKRIINRSYPGSILQLSLARISVKQMAEQRLLEEKKLLSIPSSQSQRACHRLFTTYRNKKLFKRVHAEAFVHLSPRCTAAQIIFVHICFLADLEAGTPSCGTKAKQKAAV